LIDALVAACAIGQAATLCTFNLKHYRVIAGLTTEQPYSR
jgi:predicted nucleic acid-binding protein